MNKILKISRTLTTSYSKHIKLSSRTLCTEINKEPGKTESKERGYAKAFKKFEEQLKQENQPVEDNVTFASLLRNSTFIDLGDPVGKIVQGKIFRIIEDDLYIDFGWKFHCVCPRPKNNADAYVRGARVRLLIKDLELSSKFLGYEKDITLLEADCVLLGLAQQPKTTEKRSQTSS